MTRYTLREAATMTAVACTDALENAVDQLDVEHLLFLLKTPPELDELELVITVDETAAQAGDVVVRFAAGRMPSNRN